MTQPTAAIAKLVDKSNNPQIANRQTAITAASESNIGNTAAGHNADDNALGAVINEIISVLEAHGLTADN